MYSISNDLIINSNKTLKLYNGDEWKEYRFGDVVKGYIDCKKYLKHLHNKWPHSLACKYRSKYSEWSVTNFLTIVSNEYEKPKPGTIIVHLRLGDTIKGINNFYAYRYNSNGKLYIFPLDYYKNLDVLNKNVIIVVGTHHNVNINTSCNYLFQVKSILEKTAKSVVIRHGRNPDEDFMFMSFATTYICGGGGYSTMIGDIVKFRGNIAKTVNFTSDMLSQKKILLVGTGGAGNTSMCKSMLNQGITFNSPTNKDKLKHLLHPDMTCFHKAIFVYGDIVKSIYSHYRRWKSPNNHFKNFNAKVPLTFEKLVKETVEKQTDLTGILQQISNWQQSKSPVLFVDFNRINEKETKSAIENFIDSKNIKLPILDKERMNKHDDEIKSIVSKDFIDFYKNKIPSSLHLRVIN
uniref:Uncharacterized protein n=1 Tax=Megaviridae environmental sample TaxID=1737588 RepID=A0A5J6VKN5_9VIRU|nr:MAG: hypothetical protein [Megaviridae environmental sample]